MIVEQQENLAESCKVEKDFAFILEQYLEVLRGLPEEQFIRSVAKGQNDEAVHARASQALGLYFSLLNLVEENAAAQNRRLRETAGEPCGEGMFRSVLRELRENNVNPDMILQALVNSSIEPVLTAHPTEAKRTSILEHHRALYLCLVRLENRMWTPDERSLIVDEVRSIIEKIWKTGEIYHHKPQVQDEQNNVMHYLQTVFPIAIPEVFTRLKQAWRWAEMPFPYPESEEMLPQIRLGSWVGGDRDGHPLVQAEHTRNAFKGFREGARELLHGRLAHLASSFSMDAEFARPNAAFLQRLAEMEQEYPHQGKPGETWRHYLNQMTMRMATDPLGYRHPRELLRDLAILRLALLEVGCVRLVEIELDPVIQLVRAFPFTLARLDFRQNSAFQEKAFLQLLQVCPGDLAKCYTEANEEERQKLLTAELQSSRPFGRPSMRLAGEAQATLELYALLREELQAFQGLSIGALITSMTRAASDLFVVHLLLREADIWRSGNEGEWNPLQVVPLFETIGDLENAAVILDQYLANAFVRRSLFAQARENGLAVPRQQVMVGYSDSNKDGGVVASFVALRQAQKALCGVGRKWGVEIQFFHGKGGTISRGAGPTQRFLAALPSGALQGGMRLTEQGESISKKYANRITAVYHLETLMAGTLQGQCRADLVDEPPMDAFLEKLSQAGFEAYRTLVERESFPRFFRDISPIDVLEHSRIGSRPARRTGVAGIADLRAIPWNFSWSQNRILLSGWYGFGSALAAIKKQEPVLWQWLTSTGRHAAVLKYFMGNVATVLSSTNFDVARLYLELSNDKSAHAEIFECITHEFRLSVDMLCEVSGKSLREYHPATFEALARREQGLRILHVAQVGMLEQWRAQGSPENSPLLQELLLNVNAIAAGLGHTG